MRSFAFVWCIIHLLCPVESCEMFFTQKNIFHSLGLCAAKSTHHRSALDGFVPWFYARSSGSLFFLLNSTPCASAPCTCITLDSCVSLKRWCFPLRIVVQHRLAVTKYRSRTFVCFRWSWSVPFLNCYRSWWVRVVCYAVCLFCMFVCLSHQTTNDLNCNFFMWFCFFFEELAIDNKHIIPDDGKELNKNRNPRSVASQVWMVIRDSLVG